MSKNSIYITDDALANSPLKHGFQSVDLNSPSVNSVRSRKSSVSSTTSDVSSLFPIYESPQTHYHWQVKAIAFLTVTSS